MLLNKQTQRIFWDSYRDSIVFHNPYVMNISSGKRYTTTTKSGDDNIRQLCSLSIFLLTHTKQLCRKSLICLWEFSILFHERLLFLSILLICGACVACLERPEYIGFFPDHHSVPLCFWCWFLIRYTYVISFLVTSKNAFNHSNISSSSHPIFLFLYHQRYICFAPLHDFIMYAHTNSKLHTRSFLRLIIVQGINERSCASHKHSKMRLSSVMPFILFVHLHWEKITTAACLLV